MIFQRKPRYSLSEINEYIANYQLLSNHPNHPEDYQTLDVMRMVIIRLSEYLLKEGK